jgi:hypothetical protein
MPILNYDFNHKNNFPSSFPLFIAQNQQLQAKIILKIQTTK